MVSICNYIYFNYIVYFILGNISLENLHLKPEALVSYLILLFHIHNLYEHLFRNRLDLVFL
jgi:hypothetical protein